MQMVAKEEVEVAFLHLNQRHGLFQNYKTPHRPKENSVSHQVAVKMTEDQAKSYEAGDSIGPNQQAKKNTLKSCGHRMVR